MGNILFFLKRKFLLFASTLTVSTVLTGCAISNRIGAPEGLSQAGMGYVFVSMVAVNKSYDPALNLGLTPILNASFYPANNPKKEEFSAISKGPDPKDSVAEVGGYRRIVLIAVKPGVYQMGKVEGTLVGYNKYMKHEVIDPTALEVREGEILYAGSIKIVTNVGKGLFGQALPASGKITVGDDYKSDLTLMTTFDPRVKGFPTSNGLLKKLP